MDYLNNHLLHYNFDSTTIDLIRKHTSRDGFQLLEEQEFNEITYFFKNTVIYQPLLPLLNDHNSNYICVYKEGILYEKVCYVNHEETNLEPKFRNIQKLLQVIQNNPECWDINEFKETCFDYPMKDFSFTKEDALLLLRLHTLYEQEENEDKQIQIAFCILACTPPQNIENLYPFLDNEDIYIQERTIEIIGFHQYKPAIEKLKHMQITAHPNVKNAIKTALKKINNF